MAEDEGELRALVIGFLQQSLSENPDGMSIQELERSLPDKCDEPRDWYKTYKKNSVLEALQSDILKDVITITNRYNTPFISLIKQSKYVNTHLIDLITNQKQSTKKKSFRRPSQRHNALTSFSLNRQYSNHYRRAPCSTRLNHDQHYRGENSFIKKTSPPASSAFKPSLYTKSQSSWQSSADPRLRSSSSIVPPQVRPPSMQPQRPPPSAAPHRPSFVPADHIPRPKQSKPSTAEPTEVPKDNPELDIKKSYLRQKIVSLLTNKFSEIKIFHLASLYRIEFEETLEPSAYGHSTLVGLLKDPKLSPYIQINYKSPMITISVKNKCLENGKENITAGAPSASFTGGNTSGLADVSNASAKVKLDAIDVFNVKQMINSLEPLTNLREPPLKELKVDEGVKYKTMRIIFKSPQHTLRLEDWQPKFDQETRLQIRIRDYGFKTLLEFFKHLAKELPITVKLNDNKDGWVAVADIIRLSEWMNEKMKMGHYRAITSLDAHYELVAFPNDTYNYAKPPKEYITPGDNGRPRYAPAFILSVKRAESMWIQLRTPDSIEEHLCIEASMTCYEDYKNKDILRMPNNFIRPGLPCAVYDAAQQRWCRALILKAPEIRERNCEITAFLVDYAIAKIYTASQLLCLMKSHLRLPVGPIYSKLYGVKNDDGRVSHHSAKQVLQEYTSPPVTLACRFIEAVPSKEPEYLPKSCFVVELVDTRSGRDCNLADDINLPRELED